MRSQHSCVDGMIRFPVGRHCFVPKGDKDRNKSTLISFLLLRMFELSIWKALLCPETCNEAKENSYFFLKCSWTQKRASKKKRKSELLANYFHLFFFSSLRLRNRDFLQKLYTLVFLCCLPKKGQQGEELGTKRRAVISRARNAHWPIMSSWCP